MDRRIKNTYADLQLSLGELLGCTTWDKITVQELCKKADISRSTFYSHFNDKEDLLDSFLAEFEIVMLSDNNGRSLESSGTLRYLPVLLAHVVKNRCLFFRTNTLWEGYPVTSRLRSLIYKNTFKEFEPYFGESLANDIQTQFVAGGIYQSLISWGETTDDLTHLRLLESIDSIVYQFIKKDVQ